MTTLASTAASRMEFLHILFSAATHDASAAMCRWTGGLIAMRLDEVRELPLEEVVSELDLGSELLTMIVLSLEGSVGGDMILAFDNENGRRLAASLLGRSAPNAPEWTDLERSALMETGNILGCAYMNALNRLIGAELVPSPPTFVQDYGASVLEQALMAQALTSDKALICRTSFEEQGESLDWNVFFVPSATMREAMESAINT